MVNYDEEENEDMDEQLSKAKEEDEVEERQPVKKKTIQKEEKKVEERYSIIHQLETYGIFDNLKGIPVSAIEKAPTITDAEKLNLQAQAKMLNEIEKVIIGGGYS